MQAPSWSFLGRRLLFSNAVREWSRVAPNKKNGSPRKMRAALACFRSAVPPLRSYTPEQLSRLVCKGPPSLFSLEEGVTVHFLDASLKAQWVCMELTRSSPAVPWGFRFRPSQGFGGPQSQVVLEVELLEVVPWDDLGGYFEPFESSSSGVRMVLTSLDGAPLRSANSAVITSLNSSHIGVSAEHNLTHVADWIRYAETVATSVVLCRVKKPTVRFRKPKAEVSQQQACMRSTAVEPRVVPGVSSSPVLLSVNFLDSAQLGNHRQLQMTIALPNTFSAFTERGRDLVQENVRRWFEILRDGRLILLHLNVFSDPIAVQKWFSGHRFVKIQTCIVVAKGDGGKSCRVKVRRDAHFMDSLCDAIVGFRASSDVSSAPSDIKLVVTGTLRARAARRTHNNSGEIMAVDV